MSPFSDKCQNLTDVELAILLGLVAEEHCTLQTEEETLEQLTDELKLIVSNVVNLSHAIVRCGAATTPEELSVDILVEGRSDPRNGSQGQDIASKLAQRELDQLNLEEERKIANVVILTGLSQASDHVQIQVLELMRTRRIFTHTAVHTAPRAFVLVIVKSLTEPPLLNHLNDHIFIFHHYSPEDRFPHFEDAFEQIEDDQASVSSVVLHPISLGQKIKIVRPTFSETDISDMRDIVDNVSMKTEVESYLHNVKVFLRMHRAVAGGITPLSTRHLHHLSRCLAPIHDLNFVTPSLVGLAARKVYPHRIRITTPKFERSMQYGSDLAAVAELLERYSPERVIDEVLNEIEAPL